MKKTLLSIVICFVTVVSFAQVDLKDIPYNGSYYDYPATFSGSTGQTILAPEGYDEDAAFWDLSSYTGLEFNFTCDASDVGKTLGIRLAIVMLSDTETGVAQSVVKTVTFNSTTETLSFSIADDNWDTSKLWGIKTPWSGMDTFDSDITINSINAISTATAIGDEVEADKVNPNRIVSVHNLSGVLIRKGVKYSEATKGLPKGLYIIGGKKIYIEGL